MTTIAEIKSAFYDSQRQQANLFESLVQEIVTLNQKVKDLTPAPVEEAKKD